VRELCFIVAIYPLFVFFNSVNNSFSSNLDFHGNNLSLKEMRSILIQDLLIQIGFFFGLFYLFGTIFWVNSSSRTLVFDMLGTPSVFYLWLFLGFLSVVFTKLGVLRSRQENKRLSNEKPKIWIGIIFLFFVFLLGMLILSFSLSLYLLSYLIAILVLFHLIMDWYGKVFHQRVSSKKWKFMCFFIFLVIQFFLLKFLSLQARREIHQSTYSLEQKIQTFAFFKNFSLSLSSEVVTEILISPFSREIVEDIFKYSHEDIFRLDVDDLIRRPDYKTYYAYLSLGRVEKNNAYKIYQKFKQNHEQWQGVEEYSAFRKSLLLNIPEVKDLPERLSSPEEEE
jgi:hypothetical protein